MTAFMPTSALRSTMQPCSTAPWPMWPSSSTIVSVPGKPCSDAGVLQVRARAHLDAAEVAAQATRTDRCSSPAPTMTSPISTADGCTKAVGIDDRRDAVDRVDGQCRFMLPFASRRRAFSRATTRALRNIRNHGDASPHSSGCHDICTVRNTRSGCGIRIVKRPSARRQSGDALRRAVRIVRIGFGRAGRDGRRSAARPAAARRRVAPASRNSA